MGALEADAPRLEVVVVGRFGRGRERDGFACGSTASESASVVRNSRQLTSQDGAVKLCVGRDLAQQSLFINIATMLWGANISPSVDNQGAPVLPSSTALVDKGLAVYVFARQFPLSLSDR